MLDMITMCLCLYIIYFLYNINKRILINESEISNIKKIIINIESNMENIKKAIDLSLNTEEKIVESHTRFIGICNNISEILVLQNKLR